jgi:hypothetical protein
VGALLEKRGVLARDAESAWLTLDDDAGEGDPLLQWAGSSVHYRIAEGPNRGRKVFTLQTLPALVAKAESEQLAKLSGFSLHAGVFGLNPQKSVVEVKPVA